MNLKLPFCPNIDCPARGRTGEGNLRYPLNQQEKRCGCTACGQTFAVSKGTLFYRLRTDPKCVMLRHRLARLWLSTASYRQSLRPG